MSNLFNREYLRDHQYRESNNLDARIYLHRHYGTNPTGWFRWVFEKLNLEPGIRVLEVGCGPATLWTENLDRLPDDAQVCLGELSLGMVRTARKNLLAAPAFRGLVVDAQALPFAGPIFDRVIANHMLYHVPDQAQAVAEFRRVLRPGGSLVTATNGLSHMVELHDLLLAFNPNFQNPIEAMKRYTLENAPELLGKVFEHVEVWPYQDDLVVTEVEPLLDYIYSTASLPSLLVDRERQDLDAFVRARFAEQGEFVIRKSQGIVRAW